MLDALNSNNPIIKKRVPPRSTNLEDLIFSNLLHTFHLLLKVMNDIKVAKQEVQK